MAEPGDLADDREHLQGQALWGSHCLLFDGLRARGAIEPAENCLDAVGQAGCCLAFTASGSVSLRNNEAVVQNAAVMAIFMSAPSFTSSPTSFPERNTQTSNHDSSTHYDGFMRHRRRERVPQVQREP